jgi:hypothetical protein
VNATPSLNLHRLPPTRHRPPRPRAQRVAAPSRVLVLPLAMTALDQPTPRAATVRAHGRAETKRTR